MSAPADLADASKTTEASANPDPAASKPAAALTAAPGKTSADPAIGRLQQVESSIQLENATGMAASEPKNGAATPTPAATATIPAAASSAPTVSAVPAHPAVTMAETLMHARPHAAASVDEAPAAGQIVRGLAAMVNQRGGTMTMRLDPPELGALRVQMTIARGVVSADFQASTAQAQAVIDRSLASLRTSLESQGLSVERLTVHVAPTGQLQTAREDASQNGGQQQQSQRHQHDAAGGESRGRHDQQRGSNAEDSSSGRHRRAADFASIFGDAEGAELQSFLTSLSGRS